MKLPPINPFTPLIEQFEKIKKEEWKEGEIFEKVGTIIYSQLEKRIEDVFHSENSEILENLSPILLGLQGNSQKNWLKNLNPFDFFY